MLWVLVMVICVKGIWKKGSNGFSSHHFLKGAECKLSSIHQQSLFTLSKPKLSV